MKWVYSPSCWKVLWNKPQFDIISDLMKTTQIHWCLTHFLVNVISETSLASDKFDDRELIDNIDNMICISNQICILLCVLIGCEYRIAHNKSSRFLAFFHGVTRPGIELTASCTRGGCSTTEPQRLKWNIRPDGNRTKWLQFGTKWLTGWPWSKGTCSMLDC